ncbi:MAG: ABC-F family ATP-binding cassette domain-containing protein [Chloroflexota bacterium]|nr:ABC-F family ATP-binding cassette domain-containing protein [Chloroflexota bacterium]
MSLLTARDLAKEFGNDEIFSGVSVEIAHAARIALVGPNGAGKTTLLSLLMGTDLPSYGSVSRAKGLRIGFLPQRPEVLSDRTILQECLSAFAEVRALETELGDLAERMAAPDAPDSLIARYGVLQERFESAGGYTYEQRIKTVLHGLGFTPQDGDRTLGVLSGGQKTRALLARLLLEAPDLLVLDEPTNHLDIDAIAWLEGYLKEFPGAVLVVSHDRYFMDAVANTVWELDFGALESYRGSYSRYAAQREERHARRLKEFESQQEFVAKEVEYIRRNLAGQNTRQAQGRRTRLERMLRDDARLKPRSRRDMALTLGDTARSGDLVLRTLGLRVGYPGKPLFTAPDLTLRRGEVAALIGGNGVGKSTFIKTAIGALSPLAGEVKIGAAVQIAYFAQAHELLDPDSTLLDVVTSAKPMTVGEARNYLAAFLFEGDDVFRTIATLSGGERGRVALAAMALSGANFLVLDEPTNHLDIASQEILQNVLADFPGTILLVSHDRYLIDALATHIWTAAPGSFETFIGGYRAYLDARAAAKNGMSTSPSKNAAAGTHNHASAPKNAAHPSGLTPYARKKRVEALETRILEFEAQLADVSNQLERASASGAAGEVAKLGATYTQTESALHEAMVEWEGLVD